MFQVFFVLIVDIFIIVFFELMLLGELFLWYVEEVVFYWIDIFGKVVYKCVLVMQQYQCWDMLEEFGSIVKYV